MHVRTGSTTTTSPQLIVGSALRQSSAHSRHMAAQSLQCSWSCCSHSFAQISQARMQVSTCARSMSMSWSVRRTANLAVAPHTSAQSKQVRIHLRMSICSAMQASAHEVQNREQSIAWRAAVASCSFPSPPTSGCALIIFERDTGTSSARLKDQKPGRRWRCSSNFSTGRPPAPLLPSGRCFDRRRLRGRRPRDVVCSQARPTHSERWPQKTSIVG